MVQYPSLRNTGKKQMYRFSNKNICSDAEEIRSVHFQTIKKLQDSAYHKWWHIHEQIHGVMLYGCQAARIILLDVVMMLRTQNGAVLLSWC